jgi:hypothetical protein
MDHPKSTTESAKAAQSTLPIVDPASIPHAQQEHPAGPTDTPQDKSNQVIGGAKKNYWKRLLEEKPDRHIELILAFAITFFAAAQWITSCSNNASTNKQVAQLLTAADRVDDAAESFSISASHINDGMEKAVQNLAKQNATSNRALQTSIMQFEQDRRPFLLLETDNTEVAHNHVQTIETVADNSTFGHISMNFWIKNYGRGPAIRVRSYGYISVAADAEDDIRWDKFPETGGGVTAPSGAFFKTVRTDETVDGRLYQFRDMHGSNPNLWAAHILVKYSDQLGGTFTTEICEAMQVNGVIRRCVKHNDIQ